MYRPGFPVLKQLRARLRERFFAVMRHIAQIEDTRRILADALDRQNLLVPPAEFAARDALCLPYPELGRCDQRSAFEANPCPIFVTGRFRSGSTLMWNLFRQVPATTSYYEPFNERRWFDQAIRGAKVDATHVGVADYWAEYNGLEELGAYFREEWKFERLYMPGHAWNSGMQRYIEVMIERARGRPVLQFNEVDFRLPWLRAKFPRAKIVHIYRHPRDQWCSTLQRAAVVAARCKLRDFDEFDGFYLMPWGRDLAHYFRFLTLDEEAPAYELFYQLWRLSYLFGKCHSDFSIRFEDLLKSPRDVISGMLSGLGINDFDVERLAGVVSPMPIGKWRECADEKWFGEIEARVDAQIATYSMCAGPAEAPGA